MKKIIFNGKFLSADSTGVHRVAEELITAYGVHFFDSDNKEYGIDAELWVPRNARALAINTNIKVRQIGPLNGVPWEQLTLALKSNGATVVSLCNIGTLLHPNSITMFHDAQAHSAPDSYRPAFRAWYKFIQPVCGRNHRKILTVSNYSKHQLTKYKLAKSEKIDVIHNGVDHFLRFDADDSLRKQLGLHNQKYFVGLANTQAHKNISLLLNAFSDPRLSDEKLVLFGKATKEDFESEGHKVPENVIFAGKISDEKLKDLYMHARGLLFPSLTEGFGLPPLEAQIVGCPVVAASCGSLPEICGSSAIMADPHSASEWAEHVLSLSQDEDQYEELVTSGKEHASQFTWKRSAESLRSSLLETLNLH